MFFASVFLEAFVLSASVSMDAFVTGFAYGSNKIKIPFRSVVLIILVTCGSLGVSLLAGAVVGAYLPPSLAVWGGFAILFAIGFIKLADGVVKAVIRKYSNLDREIKFSVFSLKFILRLYADPEAADVDGSRRLSPREALSLAAALALDGAAVGFGAAVGNFNIFVVLGFALATDTVAIILGGVLGEKFASRVSFNVSWLGGALLMVLAVVMVL